MINKAVLLGTIVNKEYKLTKVDVPLCTLTIETVKKHTNYNGLERDETIWHMVNFFDALANTADKESSLNDVVYVEGEIINRKVNGIIVTSIKGNFIKIVKKD